MEQSSSKVVRQIFIDFILLLVIGVPVLILFLFAQPEPYERGFFCNDNSLMHPYHKDTVTTTLLVAVGAALPIVTILIVEAVRGHQKLDGKKGNLSLGGWDVPLSVQKSYRYIGFFIFGLVCCQLSTEIGKYSTGRLRPHFLSVCDPRLRDGTSCKDPANWHMYIEEYSCANSQATPSMLKDMRLSFPSGHASYGFYTMMFCAFYLHLRFTWKGSRLVRHFLQFGLFLMALFASLSRVSDYMHHWSDVLAGAVLGITFAVAVFKFTKSLRYDESKALLRQEREYDL